MGRAGHLPDLRVQVGCVTGSLSSAVGGSSGSSPPSITTAARNAGDRVNAAGPAWLTAQPLPPVGRRQVSAALAIVEALDTQIALLDRELGLIARRRRGCRALLAHYGVGPVTAAVILAELGDPHPFSPSREAVRYAGLDIARRRTSPDHACHTETAAPLGGNRGCLAVAANSSGAATTRCASWASKRYSPHMARARAALHHTDATRRAPGTLLLPRPSYAPVCP